MQRLNSIGTRIILFLLCGSLFSLLLGFWVNYSSLTAVLHESEEKYILKASKTIQHVLDSELKTLQLLGKSLEGSDDLAEGLISYITAGDFTSCREKIDHMVPEFDGRLIIVTDEKGIVRYNHNEDSLLAEPYEVWGIDEALEGETIFSVDTGADGWAVRMIIPLIQDDTVVGTLIFGRCLDRTLLKQLSSAVNMEVGFVSLDGLNISHLRDDSEQYLKNEIIQETLLTRSLATLVHNEDLHSLSLYGTIKLIDYTFCLVLHEDTAAIHTQLESRKGSLINFSLLLFILIMVAGSVFTRQITRPLRNLCHKAEEIIASLGSKTQPVVYKGNEIQIATQVFDLLQRTLQTHLQKRKKAENRLADTNKELQLQMEELHESKQYLASIFASMEDGLFVLDPDGIVVSLNERSCSLLASSEEKIVGRYFSALIENEKWQNSSQNGKNFETRLLAAAGNPVDILLSTAVLGEKDGEENGFICVVTDITALKEAREQKKKQETQMAHSGRLAALGEMSTGIAHEINQPLAIIRLAGQYLQQKMKKEHDEKTLGTIQKIIEQIDRVTRIVRNMRTFARNDDGGSLGSTNCAESIDDALFFFREQFRVHSIELREDLAQDLPYGLVNGQHLQQIVVNLLSNARDAVEEQAKNSGSDYTMSVVVKLYRASADQACFEIRDNGIGMTASVKKNCLDSFFTTKDEGKGTGLGLSIVKSLAQASHMTLEVKSEPGEGCSFLLSYPLRR